MDVIIILEVLEKPFGISNNLWITQIQLEFTF
jgi:hypothetical protein